MKKLYICKQVYVYCLFWGYALIDYQCFKKIMISISRKCYLSLMIVAYTLYQKMTGDDTNLYFTNIQKSYLISQSGVVMTDE